MHHPRIEQPAWRRIALPVLYFVLVACVPELSWAQTSPFMTGATALQTKGRTLLAAALRLRQILPLADLRAFALLRTLGYAAEIDRFLTPCVGTIEQQGEDACRRP